MSTKWLQEVSDESEFLGRVNDWRGVMSFVILFSHIWAYTGFFFLVPFYKAVTIAVSVFFFLSGYGMVYSSKRKQNYTIRILKNKIPHLLYLALVAYCFSVVLQLLFHVPKSEDVFYAPLSLMHFIKSTNWYVYELTGFCLLFIVAMRIRNLSFRIAFMFVVSAIAFVLLYYSGWIAAWYSSIFGYVLGMIFGEIGCVQFIKRHPFAWCVGLLITGIAFVFMFVLDTTTIYFALVRNIAAFGAIVILLYLCFHVNIKSRVNTFLCKISPELYFFHLPVVVLMNEVIKNPYQYLIVVIAFSLVAAAAGSWVNQKVHIWWCNLLNGGKHDR